MVALASVSTAIIKPAGQMRFRYHYDDEVRET